MSESCIREMFVITTFFYHDVFWVEDPVRVLQRRLDFFARVDIVSFRVVLFDALSHVSSTILLISFHHLVFGRPCQSEDWIIYPRP